MGIESQKDLIGISRAGRLVALTLDKMRAAARVGMTTMELDEVAGKFLAEQGGRPAPQLHVGFPGTCCISVNDEAVHGLPGERKLKGGDVVKLDVAAEFKGYVADAAITIVLPPVAAEAERLMQCVNAALEKGIAAAMPGRRISQIGHAVESEVQRQGMFVMRDFAGHGVGRTMWEPPRVPNYYDAADRDRLLEGMVLAIEPVISLATQRTVRKSDGWTMGTADGSLAAHAEHTVIVTRNGPMVMTSLQGVGMP